MSRFHTTRSLAAAASLAAFLQWQPSTADESTIDVVTSFSILGDMVTEVGGDRVEVITLVGAGEDAHTFIPGPSDVKVLTEAELVIVNELGFEGWLDRLVEASGSDATLIVATTGIDVLAVEEDHHDEDEHDDHAEQDSHDHDEHAEEASHDYDDHDEHDDDAAEGHAGHDDHGHGPVDPHAWQDVTNAEIYVHNIAEALIAADPDGHEVYEANAERYLDELHDLDHDIREAVARLPEDHRTVVTSHDAFGYYERAYGITFIGAVGVSTDTDPSAGEIADLIRQIREEHIAGVFVESITDSRMIDRIADETGAIVGGVLYSDALSEPDGPAATYVEMMRHNTDMLTSAVSAF